MGLAPSFDIHFTFRGIERKGLVRKYNDGMYSVGLTGDDIMKDFTGNIFFHPDGKVEYHKEISAKDKTDLERSVLAAIKEGEKNLL